MFVRLLFSFYFCVKRVSFFRGSRFPGHTRRGSASPHLGGSPFFCTLFMVQPSCGAIRRFRAGEFRRLRTAGTGRTRGRRTRGMDTYGFHPSCESPRFPLFLSRRTERLRWAVRALRQYLRKTRAICRDNAATARKTEADTRSFMRVTYEVGPQGPFARLLRER